MDENNKKNMLDKEDVLNSMKKIVDIYNQLYPEKKLEIIPQEDKKELLERKKEIERKEKSLEKNELDNLQEKLLEREKEIERKEKELANLREELLEREKEIERKEKSLLEKENLLLKKEGLLSKQQKDKADEIDNNSPKKDVSNYYIGVYNENQIGLFKKINVHDIFYEEQIYKGIDSGSVAINSNGKWRKIGYSCNTFSKGTYAVNCKMNKITSFENMRTIMYNAGEISPYESGKASQKEINDVLSYAYDYYNLGSKKKL